MIWLGSGGATFRAFGFGFWEVDEGVATGGTDVMAEFPEFVVDVPEESEAIYEVKDGGEHEGEEDEELDNGDDGVAEALGSEPSVDEGHGHHRANQGDGINNDVERLCEPPPGRPTQKKASVFG